MDTNTNHTLTILYALGFEADLFRRSHSNRSLANKGDDAKLERSRGFYPRHLAPPNTIPPELVIRHYRSERRGGKGGQARSPPSVYLSFFISYPNKRNSTEPVISFVLPEQSLQVRSPRSPRAATSLSWWLPALRNSSKLSVAAVSAPHQAGLSLPSGYLSALN